MLNEHLVVFHFSFLTRVFTLVLSFMFERDTQRGTQTETERDTDRQRQAQTDRQRQSDRQIQRQKDRPRSVIITHQTMFHDATAKLCLCQYYIHVSV